MRRFSVVPSLHDDRPLLRLLLLPRRACGGDGMTMDETTKADLEADEYTRWFHSYGIRSFSCLKCGEGIRKARSLKSTTGKRYTTMTFCSQECHDQWFAQFHVRSHPPEKYRVEPDGTSTLTGWVVPKRGFVPIEEVDSDG